jgi:hypothetical protein
MPGAASTVVADGFPIGPWAANSGTSRWIAPIGTDADANAAPGVYVYRTTFTLSGLNPASVAVSGSWSRAGVVAERRGRFSESSSADVQNGVAA